jgi:DNA-binding CsgD family transcriptional regulator
MALFLDRHNLVGSSFEFATPEEMLENHKCDLIEQSRFGVSFLTYWWHEGAKSAFCLIESPSREKVTEVHRVAHGEVPSDILEVEWQTVEGFLGRIELDTGENIRQDIAFRTVLCGEVCTTDSVPADPQAAPPSRKRQMRIAVKDRGGTDVGPKDGPLLGCFPSPTAAVECALALRQSFVPLVSFYERSLVQVKIGISAGEPVISNFGLFGQAVKEAEEMCALAKPGEVLVSRSVRELTAPKGFAYRPYGETNSEDIYSLVGRENLQAPSPPAKGQLPDGLTTREIDVLQLIVAGKTNHEIGDNLMISLNTVATHVKHIYDKTGAVNRAEAAAYALRHHLA